MTGLGVLLLGSQAACTTAVSGRMYSAPVAIGAIGANLPSLPSVRPTFGRYLGHGKFDVSVTASAGGSVTASSQAPVVVYTPCAPSAPTAPAPSYPGFPGLPAIPGWTFPGAPSGNGVVVTGSGSAGATVTNPFGLPTIQGVLGGGFSIGFFGIPVWGSSEVVFVLDRSGSMGSTAAAGATTVGVGGFNGIPGFELPVGYADRNTKLEAVKSELQRTLATLPDGTNVNILFFDNVVYAASDGYVTLNAQSRAMLRDFVAPVDPGDSTAAVPALRFAYNLHPRRVIFLSDGLPNTDGGPEELLAEARTQMRQGVRFDTVSAGADQDAALMQALATESGGVRVRH